MPQNQSQRLKIQKISGGHAPRPPLRTAAYGGNPPSTITFNIFPPKQIEPCLFHFHMLYIDLHVPLLVQVMMVNCCWRLLYCCFQLASLLGSYGTFLSLWCALAPQCLPCPPRPSLNPLHLGSIHTCHALWCLANSLSIDCCLGQQLFF